MKKPWYFPATGFAACLKTQVRQSRHSGGSRRWTWWRLVGMWFTSSYCPVAVIVYIITVITKKTEFFFKNNDLFSVSFFSWTKVQEEDFLNIDMIQCSKRRVKEWKGVSCSERTSLSRCLLRRSGWNLQGNLHSQRQKKSWKVLRSGCALKRLW